MVSTKVTDLRACTHTRNTTCMYIPAEHACTSVGTRILMFNGDLA